ncbi:MAG: type IV pilus biogenesis/stability protein PilW [Proteobacteria bacterium]|jgi:type IV pilus assembly protein PilF|nr:type IV pilus biogenesis/stability protein PilW [Pseudomonadota bacterium]
MDAIRAALCGRGHRRLRKGLAVAGAVATLAAAGCATNKPATPQLPPPPDNTPVREQQATPRQRAEIHRELAAGYYQRGQMDVALQELATAKSFDPSNPKIYDVYGLVYAMLGEEQKARDNFQQALSLAPHDSDIRENWGAFLCGTGHAKESIPEFEQVLADPLFKKPEIALINLGKCTAVLGDVAKAEGYLRRALTVSPGNPVAAYNLALLAYRSGRYGEALAWMRPAVREASPPPEVLHLGMCIARKHGDADAAQSYQSQLQNRYPHSAEAANTGPAACP